MNMRETYDPVKQLTQLNQKQFDSIKFFGPSPSAEFNNTTQREAEKTTRKSPPEKMDFRFVNEWMITGR